MIDSARSAEPRDFGPARYIAPYLLLVLADAGTAKASAGDRPVLFGLFAAVAVLGVVSAAVCLRRMWATHQRRAQPGWTRLLGALLAAYGLYVTFRVLHDLTG
ncbi:hypothetical protein [Streptomyces luteogriseus]|uniref:Uncharacterized protein n=1 Tax=Streptomyces luteogriseus TaxID=68233 RepID=A0A7W7GIG2_9ACTN|nr:hypothetical protein [Streptomyces luteogriseus]MBB4713343.1 hypothetical protein [Streptomyces luteogriseus]